MHAGHGADRIHLIPQQVALLLKHPATRNASARALVGVAREGEQLNLAAQQRAPACGVTQTGG